MKLAKVTTKRNVVELHYSEKIGYMIYHCDGTLHGNEYFPTRAKAEAGFLWAVGYPEWEQASNRAFTAAKNEWLADHTTLTSVGATDLTP